MGRAQSSERPWLRIDPAPRIAASNNPALAFFAKRDLLHLDAGSVRTLWTLPATRRILAKQLPNGAWAYPGTKRAARLRAKYDQLETYRQLGILVEQFGCTREHPALERAAEFVFSSQTTEGDFRAIYGTQYATTYVGAIMELLIKAGYAKDPRIAKAFRWLVSVRQNDGGWAIPLRTVGAPFSELVSAPHLRKPIAPDRSKPSSHLVTGMVLRAFAAHPEGWRSVEALRAAEWLASRLYKKDVYGDRGDVSYWERVSFPFWFTDVVSALDTLTRLGFGIDTPAIHGALDRLRKLQSADGTFRLKLLRDKDPDLPWWVCLSIGRILERLHAAGAGGMARR